MNANKSSTPVWFITGCSSGLGRALAERVLRHGLRCVATARNPAHIADLVRAHPKTSLALALDVTVDEQRHDAVARAEGAFGSIDVLVNNAGHGYSAAIEEGEDGDIRRMFETNFFALAAMTRRVLSGMRARGRGHIVNISSIGGLVGNPASGYYCATKFAVEGLSQALAKEVAPLGIRVTLIEPGPFRTDFQGRSMTTVAKPIDAYAQTAGARRAQLRESSGKQAGDPVRAADAIIKVVESADPPLHLVLGKIGIKRVREELRGVLHSIDAWEAVSLAADFPEG
jgi:NAD(P)-dependent dehydrogenase (short-subunit alcohol dehydrogenase family)